MLPPIAKLTPAQAMYHFLSGYTAKVAGTEKGLVTEPEATFSTCFGAPFLPRHPSVYGNLLRKLIARPQRRLLASQYRLDRRQIWRRQPDADQGDANIAAAAVLDGSLKSVELRTDPYFRISRADLGAGYGFGPALSSTNLDRARRRSTRRPLIWWPCSRNYCQV